eukprot:scaffold3299_cov116-Isochrysis_galbana.AAC.9
MSKGYNIRICSCAFEKKQFNDRKVRRIETQNINVRDALGAPPPKPVDSVTIARPTDCCCVACAHRSTPCRFFMRLRNAVYQDLRLLRYTLPVWA